MTDLRKAAEMALEALLNYPLTEGRAIQALRQALAQDEKVSISRCKQCGGALPVTGALDRTGECDCIRQLRVFSTIAWFNAPIKSEWGEDMMCASVSIDKNHTLTLYCERSQIHKVPNIIKELL